MARSYNRRLSRRVESEASQADLEPVSRRVGAGAGVMTQQLSIHTTVTENPSSPHIYHVWSLTDMFGAHEQVP